MLLHVTTETCMCSKRHNKETSVKEVSVHIDLSTRAWYVWHGPGAKKQTQPAATLLFVLLLIVHMQLYSGLPCYCCCCYCTLAANMNALDLPAFLLEYQRLQLTPPSAHTSCNISQARRMCHMSYILGVGATFAHIQPATSHERTRPLEPYMACNCCWAAFTGQQRGLLGGHFLLCTLLWSSCCSYAAGPGLWVCCCSRHLPRSPAF